MTYRSTKTFDGYSVALRQWKAAHSHCSLLHGYALRFKIWFEADTLDDTNWVADFGGFNEPPQGNGLKEWLAFMFDHTLLIEHDDPYRDLFEQMGSSGLANVRIMERMGCESIAKLVYDKFNERLAKTDAGRCRVVKVEVFENERNSAIYQQ